MAKQTINIGASPNDGTGTPLRTSFDYCNLNFTELYTAVGPSGNNIVVPGTATITGALTAGGNSVIGTGSVQNAAAGRGNLTIGGTTGAILNLSIGNADTGYIQHDATDIYFSNRIAAGSLFFQTNSTTRYRIASDGVATWSNVGGVAGTAMTLNATGLGVGYTPSGSADKLGSAATLGVVATGAIADLNFRNSSLTAIQRIRYTDGTGVLTIGSATGTAYPVELGGSTSARSMTLDTSGNLLVGKTSGVNKIETVGAGVDGRGTVTGVSTVATTIYTIKQSATAAMCVVFGDDGTNGFCDIVLFLATVAPKVVSSQTLYGSPAARTYSVSTTNLQLALASGTLSIRTAALSTLNT